MRKRYKIGLIIITLLLIVISSLAVASRFLKPKEEKPKNTSSVISGIKTHGYTLDDRDTHYMKETFEELSNILNEEEINELEYAKCIAKLFVIDFYTLSNKINKYDVGSLEYIFNSKKEDFKNKAMDGLYKDLIDNTYKDRVQSLPEISNVEILSSEETTFDIEKTPYKAFKITMKYSYKKDLGYDTEGTIYIVKNNDKLEVAYYIPKIEEE